MSESESWLQVHLFASAGELPDLEAALLAAGALSITLREPGDEELLEPAPGATPLWSRMQVTGLFPGDARPRRIQTALGDALAPAPLPALRFEPLAGRAWEREWLKDFHPMRFGRRLWICPQGQAVTAPNAAVLHLDPGLAFGTGTHPTTALCLEWLDAASDRLHGCTVLDFGCGSGILGLAAALLGAGAVLATDIDPQALQAAEANRDRAGIRADACRVVPLTALPKAPVDLVLANILAATLIELAADLTARVAPGGALVLSGILDHQAEAVCAAYRPTFPALARVDRDGWTCLSGRRTA